MKITKCRLCGSAQVRQVVDLGYHPLADTFLSEAALYGPEVSYPLQLGSCGDCGHVSTLYSVSAVDRYQKHEYSYDSSNSRVAIEHFKEFAEAVLAIKSPPERAQIVDIGSNIGTLLAHFRDMGYTNVVGVEPSHNMASRANAVGVRTLHNFFDSSVVEGLKQGGPVEILLSANVLNHADDLRALLRVARAVLASDGVFVFEVPYLMDLIRGTAFDTIYHEHVHYYAIKPLAACLAKEGFSIFKVDRIDYMCGSIRVYTRLGNDHAPIVETMVRAETDFGLFDLPAYRAFMERARRVKLSIISDLAQFRADGGKIIGIGAATKGNTLLNYCRLDSDTIAYITDASPFKIGKMTPGSHIPIVGDDQIDAAVTHALILPWNIAPMLQAKLSHRGFKFYVPQVETLLDGVR